MPHPRKFQGGGGLNNLSGDRKSWGEGGLKIISLHGVGGGGMDIFWNYTFWLYFPNSQVKMDGKTANGRAVLHAYHCCKYM